MENFFGLKVEKKFRGTKTKIGIFIGTKKIFNPLYFIVFVTKKDVYHSLLACLTLYFISTYLNKYFV